MLLAAAGVLAGAATGSATGFGFALVAGPALFAALEPYEAITALSALGFVLSALVLADGQAGSVRWRALGPVLLAAGPGLALGVLALEVFSKSALQVGVGVAVIAGALFQLRRAASAALGDFATRTVDKSPNPLGGAVLTGLASGSLTTSIGVSGPPLVLWLERQGVSPEELRASLAAAFLALNLAGGAVLLAAGGTNSAVEAGTLLPLLGLVVAGHVAGAIVFRRLDGRSFRLVALGLVLAAGLASLVAGLV